MAEKVTNYDFLFKTRLSFEHLIGFWQRELDHGSAARRGLAEKVFEFIPEDHPLRAFEVSVEDSKEHWELIDLLMTAVIPTSSREDSIAAAFVPFNVTPIFATKAFLELKVLDPDNSSFTTAVGKIAQSVLGVHKMLAAFNVILETFYGVGKHVEHSYVIESINPENGLARFHRIAIDTQFVRIVLTGSKPELTAADLQLISDNPSDLDLLTSKLPTECFEFQGFSILRAIDVTQSETVSRLKQDLLTKDALITESNILELEQGIQALLSLPDARLGVIALDRCVKGNVSGARRIGRSLLLQDGMPECACPDNSVYHKAISEGRSFVINGLEGAEKPTAFEHVLVKHGTDSLYLAPLMDGDTIIGLIEIGSPQRGDIAATQVQLLDSVALLFSTALKRSLDEQEDRVQALIKKQFTAIHPVVEWKFRDVALRTLDEADSNAVHPIRFKNVHSFYGTSDIRNSSIRRGEAVQQDLAEQLGLALAVIIAASTIRPRPSLDELGYRLSSNIEKVLSRIDSGDELTYSTFLENEIESLFEEIKSYSPDVATQIKKYYGALDPQLHTLYRKRKDFDESVAIINDSIGNYVNQRQEEAQEMIPHYFEMYRTDGVEYNMYAGESLLNGGTFSDLDLRNLRLWQLITMAGVTSQMKQLLPTLPVQLETAQLILVQSVPVDIRFRVDEKQFDVDGAYNIRYEVMKKRIDKATVKDTGERLTQPGTVALVYSQESEEVEYRRYLDYLYAAGYFEGEIESFELGDLPGVTGLKALRVTVADVWPGQTSFPIPEPSEILGAANDDDQQEIELQTKSPAASRKATTPSGSSKRKTT